MKIVTTHVKNPALGWDVDVSVTAEGHESISHVHIDLNSSPICDEDLPSMTSWDRLLVQKGQYPGENHLIIKVLDSDDVETSAIDDWQ